MRHRTKQKQARNKMPSSRQTMRRKKPKLTKVHFTGGQVR